jgi:hypothetical protein
MIKISKEVVEVSNVNVTSCLHPHPLISDSYEDIEDHCFSWIPGFDSTDLGDDDEEPLFRKNNIQLYEKIEAIAVESFNKALKNMWPFLHNYVINSIHIIVDVTGMFSYSSSTLAGYNFVDSAPPKGNYRFDLSPNYLHKLLVSSTNSEKLDLKYNTIWEHEIIHLLDHYESLKASVYSETNLANEYFKYYLLGFRTEGVAELYYLLKGGREDIKTMSEAKDKFEKNLTNIKKYISENPIVTFKDKNTVYKSYDFYEVGPWVILDFLRTFEGEFHEELINSIIVKVEAGEEIEHNVVIDIIKIALRIKIDNFINIYIN